MERQGKAKLYRLVDDSDWEELGIGYASCVPVGDGTHEIVLETLEADENEEPWRQQIEDSTQYVREDMIIQWHVEGTIVGTPDGEEEEAGCSHALSFENESGCLGVMQQIECIQAGDGRIEDRQDDDDAFEMPEATVGNLPAIDDVLKSCQSNIKRHTMSQYLEQEDTKYIDQLLDLLQLLEDVEDTSSIEVLFSIIKQIVALKQSELMQILLQDQNYKKFFGLMEYNPDEHTNPRHREFIEKEVRFVSVIPVEDTLQKMIHYTFRLGYLRDIHPGVLDDPVVSRIAQMINANNLEIVRRLNMQGDALDLILAAIRNPEQATCSQVQALTLLLEYCDTAKNPFFPVQERMQHFAALCTTNFFETLRSVLQSCGPSDGSSGGGGGGGGGSEGTNGRASASEQRSKTWALCARILRRVMEQNQIGCQKYILEADPMPTDVPPATNAAACTTFLRERQAEHPLLLCIIRFVTDCDAMGVQADGCDILRSLLDPENMKQPNQKDKFLECFYATYMRWVVEPFVGLAAASVVQLTAEANTSKNAKNHLCEVLSYCVEHHGFRIKYFSIKHNTIAQLMQLCRYPDKHLRLGGIRFVRKCVSVKDKFFPRFIVKNDLLAPMFAVLKDNGTANTMTRSTIAELIHHIVSVPVKPLITYIVAKYSKLLDLLPSKDLTKVLRMKSEQLDEGGRTNGAGKGGGGDKTTDAHDERVSRDQNRYRETLNDESYFDDDDDDDTVGPMPASGGGGDSPPSRKTARTEPNGDRIARNGSSGGSGDGEKTTTPPDTMDSVDLLETWKAKPTDSSSVGALQEYGGDEDEDDEEDRSDASASVKKPRLES